MFGFLYYAEARSLGWQKLSNYLSKYGGNIQSCRQRHLMRPVSSDSQEYSGCNSHATPRRHGPPPSPPFYGVLWTRPQSALDSVF